MKNKWTNKRVGEKTPRKYYTKRMKARKTKNEWLILMIVLGLSLVIILGYMRVDNVPSGITYHNEHINTSQSLSEPHKSFENTMEIITTAYSEFDSCHTGASCLMANGEKAHIGAVASNFLPLGTKLKIAGEIYTVKDRHSKQLEDRIDIFMGYGQDSYDKAINYGKQLKTIKIYQ